MEERKISVHGEPIQSKPFKPGATEEHPTLNRPTQGEPIKAGKKAGKPVGSKPTGSKPVEKKPVAGKPVQQRQPVETTPAKLPAVFKPDEVVSSIAAWIATRGFMGGSKNPSITTKQILFVLSIPEFAKTVPAATLAGVHVLLANEKASAALIANAKAVAVHTLRLKWNAFQTKKKTATPGKDHGPVAVHHDPILHGPIVHHPIIHGPIEPHPLPAGGKKGPDLV